MPRWASRITLEIAKVRVERLQEITDSDALAEGVQFLGGTIQSFADTDAGIPPRQATPRDCFHGLWESINGDDAWDSNPWVWVIEFRRIEQ